MIRGGFLSSSERRELVACVRAQREYRAIARRVEAVLRRDGGESGNHIAKFPYLDDDTSRSGQDLPGGRPVPHDGG